MFYSDNLLLSVLAGSCKQSAVAVAVADGYIKYHRVTSCN